MADPAWNKLRLRIHARASDSALLPRYHRLRRRGTWAWLSIAMLLLQIFWEIPFLRTIRSCLLRFCRRSQFATCPVVDPVQRLLNVFDGIGDAEADVSFAIVAERCARKARYPCFFEQSVRQLFRCPASLFDVRKDIE